MSPSPHIFLTKNLEFLLCYVYRYFAFICSMCAVPAKAGRGHQVPGAKDGCEPFCGAWELTGHWKSSPCSPDQLSGYSPLNSEIQMLPR